jgi:hypothetical protein
MSNTPITNELKQNLIDELNATMNPAHVCRYAMREAVDVCGKLERENNELKRKLKELEEQTLNRLIGYNQ